MKKTIAVLISLLLFPFGLLAQGVSVGDQAPDFDLDKFGGGKITLSEFRGKVVFLNFMGYS